MSAIRSEPEVLGGRRCVLRDAAALSHQNGKIVLAGGVTKIPSFLVHAGRFGYVLVDAVALYEGGGKLETGVGVVLIGSELVEVDGKCMVLGPSDSFRVALSEASLCAGVAFLG
jgi:hypothetical protein